MLERVSPEKRKREHAMEDEYSVEFEFSNSVSLNLPVEGRMLSADELFFNGRLRPLVRSPRVGEEKICGTRREQSLSMDREVVPWGVTESEFEREQWPMSQQQRSFNQNPRCASMTLDGARGHPRRSCISLNNSRCSSPSRSISLPPTTPASPKISSKYSTKFKDFFKLKKLHEPTAKEVPSSEVTRESGASSSCRLPISPRSFWPFSRSNSAGENKSPAVVSPLPRRSNSAGESKTSSSSLLPLKINAASETKAGNPTAGGGNSSASSAKLPKPQSSQAKKGLPPLPNSNARKNSGTQSFLVPGNCVTDAVALSSQSTPSSSSPISGTSAVPHDKGAHRSGSATEIGVGSKTNSRPKDSTSIANEYHRALHDSASSIGGVRSCGASGRPVRKVSVNDARNFARGSPGRRGVWNTPNGVRGATWNVDRGSGGSKGLVRPQDMRTRDAWKGSDRPIGYTSVRVTPVLNVPVCIGPSFRGVKAPSKSKIFGLGTLFSKKEKTARAYTVLPSTDRQSGA